MRRRQQDKFGNHALRERFPWSLPFIQSSQLVLSVFVPFAPTLEIVLVVKTATDCASPRQPFADVLPLHPPSAQFDDQRVLLRGPF